MTSIKSGDSTASELSSRGAQSPNSPTCVSPTSNMDQVPTLETLLFKATNPSNKLEDVNTIKQFCDAVNNSNASGSSEGSATACRLLAHKIQSPQEREAVQALAVLEACVKCCGPSFHTEVGKFKFLNEMIKLVSPRYLANRTPEHIKKKVIEMLYLWTREEMKQEPKISEAYLMLKKQGIVKEDPVYVGGAVFASSLPPRQKEPLSAQETIKLRKLLQSKNTDDLQQANKIIKGMVQEDERKLDLMSKRHTELTMVNNNAKLLSEMLDHYDKTSCGTPELDLLKELFESCKKMQPKLFRMAAESTDEPETGADDGENDGGGIVEILNASDEITRVIDRYNMVIDQGKPDIGRKYAKQPSETLLDLDLNLENHNIQRKNSLSLLDEDMLGLDFDSNTSSVDDKRVLVKNNDQDKKSELIRDGVQKEIASSTFPMSEPDHPSIDDLLLESSPISSTPILATSSIPSHIPKHPSPVLLIDGNISSIANGNVENTSKPGKSSRQRGLDELDLLGEDAIKSHLPTKNDRSPQFAKKNEKVTMNELKLRKIEKEFKPTLSKDPLASQMPTSADSRQDNKSPSSASISSSIDGNDTSILNHATGLSSDFVPSSSLIYDVTSSNSSEICDKSNQDKHRTGSLENINTKEQMITVAISKIDTGHSGESKVDTNEIKLADLIVPLSSIKPGTIPPMNLVDGGDDGISITLHFGRDPPRKNVTAIVVTISSKMNEALTDLELKAVVPKGCKVKLQNPSSRELPAHNPFVPPAAITQVMLIANPQPKKEISLKYILSFSVDGEPQTEMGEVSKLPI